MDPKTQQTLQQQVTRLREQPSTPQKSVDMVKEAQYYLAAFRKVESRFDPTLLDKDILKSIFAWVWKNDAYNTLKLDYEKGLYLYGALGLGKSMTLQAVRQYRNSVHARYDSTHDDFRMKGILLKSASELANIYAIDGLPGLVPYTDDERNLIIDELGREPKVAKYYGMEQNILQLVFQLRYDHRRTSVTHVTTNLTMEEIAPKYGDYIADRFLEMFNFIEFKGKSLR